jgi:hypothetical protein
MNIRQIRAFIASLGGSQDEIKGGIRLGRAYRPEYRRPSRGYVRAYAKLILRLSDINTITAAWRKDLSLPFGTWWR